jgi:hypothetical protein
LSTRSDVTTRMWKSERQKSSGASTGVLIVMAF